MKDFLPDDIQPEPGKKIHSLSKSLIEWFLLLALLPLILVSWFSYQQANSDLTKAAQSELENSAALKVRFIHSWFDYRIMDINSQSDSHHNRDMMKGLINGLKKDGRSPSEYVKSVDWTRRVFRTQHDLVNFSRSYDYIYDLQLIDTEGNILYSVAKGADLGTNILHGAYSTTRFAEAVRSTRQTGGVSFSGLERYAPANNILSGFITMPLLDKSGGKLGVFAIQMRLERVFQLLNSAKPVGSSLTHYLVSADGYLRTPIGEDNWDEVLIRKINTEQFRSWQMDHGEHGEMPEHMEETVYIYNGPDDKEVIGIHKMVRLGNIRWLLISEIDSSEALESAQWLGKMTLWLVLLTAVVVIIIAFYQARRITRPIVTLAETSMKVAAGEMDHQVTVESNDEIGQLAGAFNHMLQMRQRHEQALQQSTARAQRALAELAEQEFALDQHSIVAITDVEGTITFANAKFSEFSGYSHDELIGNNHRILKSGCHSREFFREMYRTIGRGGVWHGEVCNRAKDGHHYWVDTTIVPFKGSDGKPKSYIAIRTDITERKKVEEALIEAKEVAEDAVRAKSEFLASMSHEIRTPMNGVLGMLGLLLNSELSTEQQHRAKIAQSSAQSLLTLINDILDFSKVEAGKLELELLDFNLRGMLGEFAEAMALQAHGKGLELVLDMTGIDHSIVRGDPGRLRQILTNLVGNAIKFTHEGEIVICVELHSINDQQWQFRCSVTDTGIGIPPEKLGQLFDSFNQVDASTTRKYGGTGLGLAISKKLCELMGDDISVSSEPGKGSCFEINVRLGKSQKSQMVIPRVNMQALNLLIVDDNAANRGALRRQLEHWGATVVEAMDGAQALAICDERAGSPFFDIAFLDMQMPKMDGIALGQALKLDARFRGMKLVMMTSMSHQEDGQRFAELGFRGQFPKPATTSDLFNALAVVTEGEGTLQQAESLVTHHLQKTPDHNDHEGIKRSNRDLWPANTRLLLVEDNQINQLVASGILRELGLQVDTVANGIEALDSLQHAPDDARYSLVLMDCQMPEMDGYQASREIRAGHAGRYNCAIPIIAMTANAMQGDREKCLNAGMNDYLPKPIDSTLLRSKLEQWLLKGEARPVEVMPIDGPSAKTAEQFPVWDKESVLKRVIGNEALLTTLIDVVLKDIPIQIKALQQAVDNGNIEQIRHLAHSIKGVAGNLGGMHLQHRSALLESAAIAGDSSQMATLMADLQQASDQLKQLLKQYQQSCVTTSAPQLLSDEQLIDNLKILADKLKACEYIALDEVQSLRQASTDLAVQALLNQLLEQIAQFESDAALDTLTQIIATA